MTFLFFICGLFCGVAEIFRMRGTSRLQRESGLMVS